MSVTDLDDRERERLSRSALIACAFWAAAFGLLSLLPARVSVDEKREFKSVTVRLSAAKPSDAFASKPAEASAAPSTAPSAAPSPAARAPSKPSAKSAVAGPRASSSSVSSAASSNGLGIPDFAPVDRGPAPAGRESATLEFSSEPVVKPAVARKAVSEFEGSVAVASPRREAGASATGASRPSSGAKEAASDETSRSLSAITGSAGTGSDGVESSREGTAERDVRASAGRDASAGASAPAGASVGAISFTEGAARRLVHPAKPSLALPDRLARLIDSNRAVYVSITVRADGSVPRSTVVFSPSALLPPEVRDYIAGEVSSWRFDRGSGDGQARFSYSIKVQ